MVEHQAYNTVCVQVSMKRIMQRVFYVRYELRQKKQLSTKLIKQCVYR